MSVGQAIYQTARSWGRRPLRVLVAQLEHPERRSVALAVTIGAVTALGALGFSWLIKIVTQLCFEVVGQILQSHNLFYWLLPLLPMGGAVFVGLIIFFVAPEAEGHGVPEVMDAMARQAGRIRALITLL